MNTPSNTDPPAVRAGILRLRAARRRERGCGGIQPGDEQDHTERRHVLAIFSAHLRSCSHFDSCVVSACTLVNDSGKGGYGSVSATSEPG